MLNWQILWNLPYYNRVLRKMTGGKNLSWCWMSFNIAKKRKYSIIKLLASVRQKKENLIVILFKLLFATYIDKDIRICCPVRLRWLTQRWAAQTLRFHRGFNLFFPCTCTCSCDIIFRLWYVIPLQIKCWMGSGFRNLSIPLLCQVHTFLERSYLAQVKVCLKLGHDP